MVFPKNKTRSTTPATTTRTTKKKTTTTTTTKSTKKRETSHHNHDNNSKQQQQQPIITGTSTTTTTTRIQQQQQQHVDNEGLIWNMYQTIRMVGTSSSTTTVTTTVTNPSMYHQPSPLQQYHHRLDELENIFRTILWPYFYHRVMIRTTMKQPPQEHVLLLPPPPPPQTPPPQLSISQLAILMAHVLSILMVNNNNNNYYYSSSGSNSSSSSSSNITESASVTSSSVSSSPLEFMLLYTTTTPLLSSSSSSSSPTTTTTTNNTNNTNNSDTKQKKIKTNSNDDDDDDDDMEEEEEEKNDGTNRTTTTTTTMMVWDIWLQSIFGTTTNKYNTMNDNDGSNSNPDDDDNNNNNDQHYYDYHDMICKIHCMNIIWTFLSQPQHDDDDHQSRHGEYSNNSSNISTNHYQRRQVLLSLLTTTVCQQYIGTNTTMHISMPIRHQEWYNVTTSRKRMKLSNDCTTTGNSRTTSTDQNETDTTVRKIQSSSSSSLQSTTSFVVNMIQSVLQILQDIVVETQQQQTTTTTRTDTSRSTTASENDNNNIVVDMDDDDNDDDIDDDTNTRQMNSIEKDSTTATIDGSDRRIGTVMDGYNNYNNNHNYNNNNRWTLVHRALELLCDLSSTPPIQQQRCSNNSSSSSSSNTTTTKTSSTPIVAEVKEEEEVVVVFHREPLIEYLLSIHFMIQCQIAMNQFPKTVSFTNRKSTNDDNNNNNNNIRLTLQLLHRLSKWVYCFPSPLRMLQSSPAVASTTTKDDNNDNPNMAATTTTTTATIRSIHYHRATIFQKFCHRYYFQQLSDIIYAGPGLLCNHIVQSTTTTANDGNNNGNNNNNYTTVGAKRSSSSSSFLRHALDGLNHDELHTLLYKMRLVESIPPVHDNENYNKSDIGSNSNIIFRKNSHQVLRSLYLDRNFLLSRLEEYLFIPIDPLLELQTYPLYPTELVLWDFTQIPSSGKGDRNERQQTGQKHTVLAIPKLTTRYLNFIDYLGRNFELVRYESAYEIRLDLIDAIRRVQPVVRHVQQRQQTIGSNDDNTTKTVFSGWARMALEIQGTSFGIKQVNKPMLDEMYPAQVIAEFSIDMKLCNTTIRQEWDGLGEHDILFLIAIDGKQMKTFSSTSSNTNVAVVNDEDDPTFPQRYGVTLVRGCMILQVRDEAGNILNSNLTNVDASQTGKNRPSGTKRIFRVALDPTQYTIDRNASSTGITDIYDTFNLVVRRSGKVNNFKAILETIRGLMVGVGSIDRVIPHWMQSAILGLGNPIDPTYQSDVMKTYAMSTMGVPNPDAYLDYGDSFLDEAHVRSSFMDLSDKIVVDGRDEIITALSVETDSDGTGDESSQRQSNYRVRVIETDNSTKSKVIEAMSYTAVRRSGSNGNSIRFTPRQVAAIRSGLSPGLSLIVGPPGTGKTDVAVQVIACLYHSFPTQRTIIITHSNAALNDIFHKVMIRGDIDERYMVRLGSGERELQSASTHDFTKQGRVAYSLSRRGILLEQVQQLSESLGISGRAERGVDGAAAYTCETADYFYSHHIRKRVQKFESVMMIVDPEKVTDVSQSFPFSGYFKLHDVAVSYTAAKIYISQIDDLFNELAEYRPLEILRSQRQRSDYLIMKQARVVAMTCTHAAIARYHLLELGFEYDNVVIEEAGQMLEIESFIPLLLQRGDASSGTGSNANRTTGSRLKRCCIIGDHHQLPPVIQNMAFAKYSSFDQSLFARLIRFGVPYIQLDRQGRCRPEIANLFNWRYNELGNLDRVVTSKAYNISNPGLLHTMQLINVDDFEGKGETSPTPYFYQNVGEAEYIVAVFQYLVLIGHKPESISILTTYNGQKALIEDILNTRCGNGTPLVGIRPRAVSTVDQYQGQQNDIILLSLVRTGSTIGHIRDIRRLIVAVSRARLGLYVFCRLNVFRYHHDIQRVFDLISHHSNSNNKLQLVVGEQYPTERQINDMVTDDQIFEVDDVVHMGSIVHQMQENMLQDGP